MKEWEVVRAATTTDDHVDRYINVLARLLGQDEVMSGQPVTESHASPQMVHTSIFRCYIFLKDNGHEGLAHAFIQGRRRERLPTPIKAQG